MLALLLVSGILVPCFIFLPYEQMQGTYVYNFYNIAMLLFCYHHQQQPAFATIRSIEETPDAPEIITVDKT